LRTEAYSTEQINENTRIKRGSGSRRAICDNIVTLGIRRKRIRGKVMTSENHTRNQKNK